MSIRCHSIILMKTNNQYGPIKKVFICICFYIMTSSNWNIFGVIGHLCVEFTSHPWIPRTRPVTRNLDVSLICACINDRVNIREAGDFRRHRAHCDVTVMKLTYCRILNATLESICDDSSVIDSNVRSLTSMNSNRCSIIGTESMYVVWISVP